MTASTGASEKRRAQVRHAQKAYNSRKKVAHASMMARVQQLEQIVQGMYDALLNLNDALITLEVCRTDYSLMRKLEAALQHALSLASAAFQEQSRDVSDRAADASAITSENSSSVGHDTTTSLANPGDAVVRRLYLFPDARASPTLSLNVLISSGVTQAGRVLLKHPLAKLVFPSTTSWSPFTRLLHESAAMSGYQALMSDSDNCLSQQAERMFRYPLRHYSHENVLKALCLKQNFKNLNHTYPDGTIVVQRREPSDPRLKIASSDLDDGEKASATLSMVLEHIDKLNLKIEDDFVVHQWESMEYLRSEHVEGYLVSKGLVIGWDAMVYLPLRPQIASNRPEGARILPANRQSSSPKSSSADAHQPEAERFPTQPDGTSTSTAMNDELDPRLWHQPACFFPSFDQPSTQDVGKRALSIPWGTASVPDLSSLEAQWRNPVRAEDLIQRLVTYSICDGAGPCFPLKRIDAALASLLICAGHRDELSAARNGPN